LNASDQRLQEVVAGIKGDRANSYMSDADLRQFAVDHGTELGEYGYKAPL
jgi:hypothetical protein